MNRVYQFHKHSTLGIIFIDFSSLIGTLFHYYNTRIAVTSYTVLGKDITGFIAYIILLY